MRKAGSRRGRKQTINKKRLQHRSQPILQGAPELGWSSRDGPIWDRYGSFCNPVITQSPHVAVPMESMQHLHGVSSLPSWEMSRKKNPNECAFSCAISHEVICLRSRKLMYSGSIHEMVADKHVSFQVM